MSSMLRGFILSLQLDSDDVLAVKARVNRKAILNGIEDLQRQLDAAEAKLEQVRNVVTEFGE